MKKTRKLQIGVMGSAADTQYTKGIEAIAEKIGELIAKQTYLLHLSSKKR